MALLLFYLFYILFYFHVRQFLVRSCIFKVYYVGRYAGVWIEQHFQVQSFKVKMETTQLLSLTSHLMYSVCVCNNAARTCFAHETETYCKPHLHIALMFQILSCNIFAVSGEKYDMSDIFYSAMLKQCCIWDISQIYQNQSILTSHWQNHVVTQWLCVFMLSEACSCHWDLPLRVYNQLCLDITSLPTVHISQSHSW